VASYREPFEARIRLLRKSLAGSESRDFEDAARRIRDFLKKELRPESKGVVIFARGGSEAFFLPMQFRVPLPNWVVVGSTPNIFHLVELKDTYDRYVVMISTEESARILEVNLGKVTEELWRQRPELRQRVGREWTKEHYQNHRRHRNEQFIKEKVNILEQLMSAGGHTHLILAGSPRITARVREALPRHLAAKLVDTVVASGSDRIADVIAATITSFVEQEEIESQAVVEMLLREINTGGLAVSGTQETLNALQRSQVDVLVMAKDYGPGHGSVCQECGAVRLVPETLIVCVACGEAGLRKIDLKAELARMAEQGGCQVEVVNYSDALMQLGGVGALLRYLSPEQYAIARNGEVGKQVA